MIRRVAVLACLLTFVACEPANPPAQRANPPSSSSPAVRAGGSAPAKPAQLWDEDIGGVLATPSLDGGAPEVFSRDTASTADIDVELLSHDDRTVKATLHPGAIIRACAWRRNATITAGDARIHANSWSLALTPGTAIPYGIDAVADLPPRDSAATVARISRLASAVAEDSTSAPYRGLPIVVRDAWRFRLADSTAIDVAVTMRSLNVESNPQAEATTLIAEPDPSRPGSSRTAFSERVSGPEDRTEGMDVLAAFELHGARPAIALVREGDLGLQIQIVERTAPGHWTTRWTSAALPCTRP